MTVETFRTVLKPFRTVLKKNATVAAVVLLTWSFAGAANGADVDRRAHDIIETTAQELLALIEASRSYVDEDPERFFAEVEALLSPVIDFNGFARRVMSVHYKKATEEQRMRFAENFKWGLVRTYALLLTEFTDGEVIVLPPKGPPRNPKRQNVKMEIHAAGGIFEVTYTMSLGKDDVWRMGNIVIAGVNIGLTYRSQFVSAASDKKYEGSLDRVIDAWAQVVADNDEADSGP